MGRKPDPVDRLFEDSAGYDARTTYRMLRAHFPPGEYERTSFRLSPAAGDARDTLIDQLQISQRELFDRIPVYLDEAVRTYEPQRLRDVLSALDGEGERKTYLVSSYTLERIVGHADRLGVARDSLVSFALLGLQYLAERGEERARQRRSSFAAEVDRLAGEVRRLHLRAENELDPDDALQHRLAALAADLEILAKQLAAEARGGTSLSRRP